MNDKMKKIIYVILIGFLIFNVIGYVRFLIIKIDNSGSLDAREKLVYLLTQEEEFYFRDISKVEWDKLYVYPPYTSREEAEKEIQKKWSSSRTFLGYQIEKKLNALSTDDSVMTLLFTNEGKVVMEILWFRGDGDLVFLTEESPIKPDDLFTEKMYDKIN